MVENDIRMYACGSCAASGRESSRDTESEAEEVEGRVAEYLYRCASVNSFVMLSSSSRSTSPEKSVYADSSPELGVDVTGGLFARWGGRANVMGESERRRALRGDTGMARESMSVSGAA